MHIDLHIHTNASDGSYSPSEILAFAREGRLGAIAFTDHDTIDGVEAFGREKPVSDIRFLTGVEITAQEPPGLGLSDSLHILGYGIQVEDPELGQLLLGLQKARDGRTPLIIEKLQQLGLELTYQELSETFSVPQLGRPHIAQLMERKGYVGSIGEAFERYLGRGKPAYVDKVRISCARAIEVIHHARGVAVLAHPGLYDLPDDRMETLIRELKESGLQGIEIYYPEHSKAQTAFYETLAERYALLVTGGTDFHGAATPGIQLGVGRGDLNVPYHLYEKILRAL